MVHGAPCNTHRTGFGFMRDAWCALLSVWDGTAAPKRSRNIQTHQKSGSGCRGLVDLFCGMDDCGVMRGSGRSQNLGVLSNDGLIPLFAASLMLI